MKKLKQHSSEGIRYYLEGDLEDVIKFLQSKVVTGVKQTIDISLGYDDCIEIELEEYRMETDQEEEIRETQEKTESADQRRRELNQLEILKKKYATK